MTAPESTELWGVQMSGGPWWTFQTERQALAFAQSRHGAIVRRFVLAPEPPHPPVFERANVLVDRDGAPIGACPWRDGQSLSCGVEERFVEVLPVAAHELAIAESEAYAQELIEEHERVLDVLRAAHDREIAEVRAERDRERAAMDNLSAALKAVRK